MSVLLGIGGCPFVYSKDNMKTGNLNIVHTSQYLKSLWCNMGPIIGSYEWFQQIEEIEKEWKPLIC